MASPPTKTALKAFFETGDTPTQAQFANLIEALPNYSLAVASAVGDGTVTLHEDPDGTISANCGYLIIEPYSTNCETRRVTSVAGKVLTLNTPVTLTASNISFTAATKRITQVAEEISKFFPGTKITITGSASNNGVFTVADYPAKGVYDGTYITTVEALTDEAAGAAVTIVMKLNRAHAVGTPILCHPGPLNAMWYGAKPTGDVADDSNNRTGIQRMFDDSYYSGCSEVYFHGFGAGRYRIDAPLYLEKLTHVRGPHHKAAILAPTSDFVTWNDDVALLITRRNGLTCRFANGGNDRYHISGFGFDGMNLAAALSTGFDSSAAGGTGYAQTGTNTFSIHATLYTDVISYRAIAAGTGGNAIRVGIVSAGAGQTLDVSVSGNDITIRPATDGSSVITSTAADVVAAVNADVQANLLISASGVVDTQYLVSAFALTTLSAGTAPFTNTATDAGRSLYIGMKKGARNIVTVTNTSTVVVDGDVFVADPNYSATAGLRWAMSPINGMLGSYNQTCLFTDTRLEDFPGYAFCATGAQEFTIRSMMCCFNGVHMRMFGVQFAHCYDMNFEHSLDAYVTFETDALNTTNRSNIFCGGHIEDIGNCDYFRASGAYLLDGLKIETYHSTSAGSSAVLVIEDDVLEGSTYGIENWVFSGPNSGPTFIDDGPEGYTIPMTNFGADNNYTVAQWTKGANGVIAGPGMGMQSPAFSSPIAPDARKMAPYRIVATAGSAFTISNPLFPLWEGQEISFEIYNNSGGALGTITWGNAFKLGGAFTNPANGARRLITFRWNGANWMEVSRTAADIT
jgi:hypothetical protein